MVYVGQTVSPNARKSSHLNGHSSKHNWKLRKFISKFGSKCLKFDIIWEGDCELLDTMEPLVIKEYKGIYGEDKLFNITEGGEGVDSKTALFNVNKRLKDGTHPFLQPEFKENTRLRNLKNIENGTFSLTSELATKTNLARIKNNTHHFLNNTLSTVKMKNRMDDNIPYVIAQSKDSTITFWNSKEIKDYGFNLAHVISVCKNRLKSHKGFTFKYHPDYISK